MDAQQAYFRRGQVGLLVAAPGVGKSVIANAYVLHPACREVRSLYVSLDTDGFTTCLRAVGSLAGLTTLEAEQAVSSGDAGALQALSTVDNVTYSFTDSADAAELGEMFAAYREAEGSYPQMAVIDNLGNLTFDGERHAALTDLMLDLQRLAKKTGTFILVLHHANTGEDGSSVLGLADIQYKLGKWASLCFTARMLGDTAIAISVVKNRFGPRDPAGQLVQFHLAADLARATITDPWQ